MPVISIDIGSTYTKGALFEEEGGKLAIRARTTVPTTVSYLPDGFQEVLSVLRAAGGEDAPVYFSSSAKGGLAIAALGIVPELTLKTAKITALSAGGKVDHVFSYKLSRRDLAHLEEARPDIILLAGGTDGGNEAYVMHNARMIAKSESLREKTAVIYAGNEACADDVEEILSDAGFDVRVADNILPQVDKINPGMARGKIRDVFLERIVSGRGLAEVVKETGHEPNPTPFAVLSLVEAISEREPDFGDFILIDLGGATTDIYSSCKEMRNSDRVVYRGIPEPDVKRTVEGDLGMRVSAMSAALTVPAELAGNADFQAFIKKVAAQTSYLGDSEPELGYDRALALACVRSAIVRHAGTRRRVFTAMGETFLQQGKDLRGVKRIIGSGGYLSRTDLDSPEEMFSEDNAVIDLSMAEMSLETFPLIPRDFEFFRDKDYIFPLLGNLVGACPEAAVKTALSAIIKNGASA